MDMREMLADVAVIDVHTHLVGGHLGAKGLHDILLYHMAISELYAAGCPSGHRLTQYPQWPDATEAQMRIQEAIPFLPYVRNTSISWGIRRILADLYDWHGPINADNWQLIDAAIRERADDAPWPREVLKKCNIKRVGTEIARRENGESDDILQYALEWGFFTRCQWDEYDTALYELERCWGQTPESPSPIGSEGRPPTERTIQSLNDLHAAMDWYVQQIPAKDILATATHVSTDLDLSPVTTAQIEQALTCRPTAGSAERDVYASYINEAFLTELESRHGEDIVFQFSFGAEPLPYETGSRFSQRSIAQIANVIRRHPKLRFQCLLASRHANQSLCTLARELPNLSLAGYWWHNFFPSTILQVMDERLDMLPLNRQVGFFSDAYCIEWVYGKAMIVRRCLAEVLADRVHRGQYTTEEAADIAQAILFETPQSLLRFEPSQSL
jgi:hypothetical protein